jgi:hypothetical protein
MLLSPQGFQDGPRNEVVKAGRCSFEGKQVGAYP